MFTVCGKDEDGSPWPIFERILASHDELVELREMLDAGLTLAFMRRYGVWERGGRSILGKCYLHPSAQGDLRALFEQLLEDTLGYYPDYLVLLNGEWWDAASEFHREVLVCHEALHPAQAKDKFGAPKFNRLTGLPVPGMRGHDLEEFACIAERYGAWEPGVAEFAAALARHGAQRSFDPAEGDVF